VKARLGYAAQQFDDEFEDDDFGDDVEDDTSAFDLRSRLQTSKVRAPPVVNDARMKLQMRQGNLHIFFFRL
jgi:hypothetical protein